MNHQNAATESDEMGRHAGLPDPLLTGEGCRP